MFTGQLGTAHSQLGAFELGNTASDIALAGRFVLNATMRGAFTIDHALAGRFVVPVRFDDNYTGPGSGLVVEGVGKSAYLEMLREGDTFRATLPWAGVRGRSGLVRVLSRTIDNAQRLTFVLLFIPNTDPSIMQSQADSGRPRYVVTVRANLARRMKNAEKTINTLES